VKTWDNYFDRATARNKGTCTNLTTIKRDVLEETVLGGLQDRLMDIALIDVFCAGYTKHLNRLWSDAVASLEGSKAELAKIDREMELELSHDPLQLASSLNPPTPPEPSLFLARSLC
jgi:site-specific DNA recombinase